ncbi:heterokaryon incompatibility protein-domain-containing protein [Collybia nuda]|uniref:Heterokaryon incompatibility protein-domain-containing protein n=1 Tax=Collybia nuda TaxID=64659 RepID=A0A9P6C9B9_9AGAR|nr:heterokaryon incompatibility protein-domain-containing protein [Collybia nuda]
MRRTTEKKILPMNDRESAETTPMDRITKPDNLELDIKKMVCKCCWETMFSSNLFDAMWGQGADLIDIRSEVRTIQDLCNSSIPYRRVLWAEVLESAEGFCAYCTLIRDQARYMLQSEPPQSEVLTVTIMFNLVPKIQLITLCIWGPSNVTAFELKIYAETEDPAGRYVTVRNVAWKVDDSASYELALKCVDDCSRHECCPQPAQSILPTRVLDCSDPSRLRLVTTDPSKKDYFAALSYVWGGPQLHCTTMKNFNAYKTFIDPVKIPKTIRDAIIVTRRLGLRYLWVDSFCIIQDSDDDKAHEIVKMGLNFRHAFITIVATRANAAPDGFLKNTYPSRQFKPIRLPFRCPDGTYGIVTAVHDAEPLGPVDLRAWCLEERVLSPRLLLFSDLGLQYECQSGRMNVNGSTLGLPHSVSRLPDHAFHASPNQDSEQQLDTCWDNMIQQYTESHLTKPETSLLQLELLLNNSISFGLRRDLQTRPKIYRAPSWSWAAVEGRTRFYGVHQDTSDPSKLSGDCVSICEVNDVVINLKHSGNPYGEITSASLVLCASILQATWNNYEDSSPQMLYYDGVSKKVLLGNKERDLTQVGFVQMDTCDPPDFPVVEVTFAGVVKHATPLPFIARLGQHDIHGIMLLPAYEGENATTYRRIGTFTMNAENWFPNSRQDICII